MLSGVKINLSLPQKKLKKGAWRSRFEIVVSRSAQQEVAGCSGQPVQRFRRDSVGLQIG
jgi:hypothetical protein